MGLFDIFSKKTEEVSEEIQESPQIVEEPTEEPKKRVKHQVGDVNDDGKVWTEYSPGKFGWRKAPKEGSEQASAEGYVYVISNVGSFGPNIFKIGATKGSDPEKRVKDLSDASVPFQFAVHAFIKTDNTYELESQIHRFLRDKEVNRINHKKEFFACTLDEIKDIVKKLGYTKVKWDDSAVDINYLKSKELWNNEN